jgi:hypothetical protein
MPSYITSYFTLLTIQAEELGKLFELSEHSNSYEE